MDTEHKDDLFSLKLNSTGIDHLLKFASLIKTYLIFGLAWCGISLIDTLILLFNKRFDYGDKFVNLYFSAYPFLAIILTCVFIIQLIIYNRLGNNIKTALTKIDENLFNDSFSYLVRGLWFVIVLNILSVILGLAGLIVTLKLRFK